MASEVIFLKLLIAIGGMLGLYLLVRCVAGLARVIFPNMHERFAASSQPKIVRLPQAGRYLINIVVPPIMLITGPHSFPARFTIRQKQSGAPIDFHPSKLSVRRVRRTDMNGRKSLPLGFFDCRVAGEYEILCVNPDMISPDYQLEISPSISSLKMVALVFGTIVSFGMLVGGMIMTGLWMVGKI